MKNLIFLLLLFGCNVTPNEIQSERNTYKYQDLLDLFKDLSPKGYLVPSKIDTNNRIIRSIEIELNKKSHKPDVFKNQNIDNFLVIGIKQDRQNNRDLIKKRLT